MVSDTWKRFSLSGLSTDALPHDCPNGTKYRVIDTGNIYYFDAENDKWYDKDGNEVDETD